jgi:arylformamidase
MPARTPVAATRIPALPIAAALLCALAFPPSAASAQRQRIWRPGILRRVSAGDERAGRLGGPLGPASVPVGVRVLHDVAYGSGAQERLDVYAPGGARGAPVLVMVHGGGWSRGDKAMRNVVENKVARWVPRGFVLVSANYPMLPDADPVAQARAIARAVAFAQRQAAAWGGDGGRFVLMGHSAGAHLVSLLSANGQLAREAGVRPWLGTVSLDGATLNVVQTMEGRHLPLYDRAFGKDPSFWRAASPFQALSAGGPPMLLVCSSRRSDSCPQARAFSARAAQLGRHAIVLPVDLSHEQVNETLGQESAYTTSVEDFLRSLHPSLAALLRGR